MSDWNAEALRVIDLALAFGIDEDLRRRMAALIETSTNEMFEAAFPLPGLPSAASQPNPT